MGGKILDLETFRIFDEGVEKKHLLGRDIVMGAWEKVEEEAEIAAKKWVIKHPEATRSDITVFKLGFFRGYRIGVLKCFFSLLMDGLITLEMASEFSDLPIAEFIKEGRESILLDREDYPEKVYLYALRSEMFDRGRRPLYALVQSDDVSIRKAAARCGQSVEEFERSMKYAGFEVPTSV